MIKNYFLLSILLVVLTVNNVFAIETKLATEKKSLTYVKLARLAVENYLSNNKTDFNNIILKNNHKDRIKGVFVTIISKNNQPVGCWGSLNPPLDLKLAITSSAVDAVKKDYRTKQITLSDLNKVRFQVSIVKNILPVDSFGYINPAREGLMVKSGGKTGIILPGEAIDSYYQMVQAKLKAGIKPNEPCYMFKLVTTIYKE